MPMPMFPVASYGDVRWARHAFLPHERGWEMRDEPNERLRRRLMFPAVV